MMPHSVRISMVCLISLSGLIATTSAQEKLPTLSGVSPEAMAVHHAGMLFDGHNDLPYQLKEIGQTSFDRFDISKPQPKLHTDIDRLRAGGVKAQFWSVYVPASTDATGDALLQTLQQIDIVHRMVKKYPDVFEMASTADDIERISKSGKIASMMGIEGGYSIQESIPILGRLYGLGCRYMTLTHSKSLSWADSATDEPRARGVSPFGEEVVAEMNRLGMLVDLSHVSDQTMRDAIRVSAAPVIFSHSSVRAINSHKRNVPDDILPLVKKNNGVVMINFFSGFVAPDAELAKDAKAYGSMKGVVDHIEHVIKTIGVDHVGIGSDYDGVTRLPIGLESAATYPRITQELLNRGYSQADIHKILGGNIMRVLREAEQVAKKLSAE